MFGFKLTREFADQGFSGGTINATPLGHAFDVGAALEAGEGVIATEDDILASVLRSYPALEELPKKEIPEGVSASIMPGREELAGVAIGPPTLQSGIVPGDWREQPGAGEIPAEHADPADTPEGEIQVGEDVSGNQSTDESGAGEGEDQSGAGEGAAGAEDQSGESAQSRSSSSRFSR